MDLFLLPQPTFHLQEDSSEHPSLYFVLVPYWKGIATCIKSVHDWTASCVFSVSEIMGLSSTQEPEFRIYSFKALPN